MNKAIQIIRQLLFYNVTEFADLVGMNPSMISAIESGGKKVTPLSLSRISNGTGIPEHTIIRWSNFVNKHGHFATKEVRKKMYNIIIRGIE